MKASRPQLHVVWSDPLGRWLVRRGLDQKPLTRIGLALAVGWMPLWLITWSHGTDAMNALASSFEVHLRMLVAVPLLIGMAGPMDRVINTSAQHASATELLPFEARQKARAIVGSTSRLASSPIPLAVCLLLLLLGPWLVEHTETVVTPWRKQAPLAARYYFLVAGTLTRFLVLRVLWRWLLWCRMILRLSLLNWRLHGTHPDGVGGIGVLTLPSIATLPLTTALAALVSGHWSEMLQQKLVSPIDLGVLAATFTAMAVLMLAAPLAAFLPRSYYRRMEEIARYAHLATRISVTFERKWLDGLERIRDSAFLTAPDFSATADFTSTYKNCTSWRLFAFSNRQLLQMVIVTTLPFVPLVFLAFPWREVLSALANVLL